MPAGQSPTWLPKIVTAALVVVIAAVLLLVYHSFRGSFAPGITVTVETDRAGLMLDRGSMVKAHGVQVGTVASVVHTQSGAVVELSLNPDDAARIPVGVGADIRATTVFGAKYVTLTDPPIPGPTGLSDGTVLLASNVTVETNTVFESLSGVLQAVDPAKLNSTLGALSSALRGRGDALGGAIEIDE